VPAGTAWGLGVTSKDVAREANVSQPTVSRALGGDPRISASTRERVAEAARRLGYFPNVAARTLITNRTHTVGVVVGDVSNLFFAQQLNAIYNELQRGGYRTVLFQEGADHKETGDAVLPFLFGNALDGAIFTTGKLTAEAPKHLAEEGLPVVLLNRYIEGVSADCVTSDNTEGGRLAARRLAELGHERIGVILGPENTSTSRDRERGFLAGLKEFDLEVPEDLRRVGLYSIESGHRLCSELLELKNPPTAIFCGNDVIALGALNAAAVAGMNVPEDLSVFGFDDLLPAAWETTNLSTVHQPISQMAEAAARMLVERIEGSYDGPPRDEVFPVGLAERATTAPPRRF
jgi:LacI family transcriptional regulator